MEENLHFGERLKFYMKSKGIQSIWLSEKLGISHPVINSYYKSDNPRRETKAKILGALGITEEELYAYGNNEVQEEQGVYETKDEMTQIPTSELQFLLQQSRRVTELMEELLKLKEEQIKELEKFTKNLLQK